MSDSAAADNGGKGLVGGCGFAAGGQGSGTWDAQTPSTALVAVAGPPRKGDAQHAHRAHRNAVISAGANMVMGWVRAVLHGGTRQAARNAWVTAAVAVGWGWYCERCRCLGCVAPARRRSPLRAICDAVHSRAAGSRVTSPISLNIVHHPLPQHLRLDRQGDTLQPHCLIRPRRM